MRAEMKYITVNPTWNVPPSIVTNEYLPVLRQDPTILARMGLERRHNRDGTIHISQPPGDNNALGRMRFNFPNKFLVYQHDTPDKNLFATTMRACSHGCMRVQDPVKYAEVLLGLVRPGEGYTQERIRRMYRQQPRWTSSFRPIMPVHLTYQTAFVDDEGRLQFRRDIYGRDKALLCDHERRRTQGGGLTGSSAKTTPFAGRPSPCPTICGHLSAGRISSPGCLDSPSSRSRRRRAGPWRSGVPTCVER